MIRSHALLALSLVCGSVLLVEALAERPREPEEAASWVVTRTVSKVFSRDPGESSEFVYYVVQIRIDAVEKGDGYRKGDSIYAYAIRRKPDARTDVPGIGGHRGVPDEGQRIRAWIKHARGQMEALYPRWFEVLEADDEAAE